MGKIIRIVVFLLILLSVPFKTNASTIAGSSALLAPKSAKVESTKKIDINLKRRVIREVLMKYNSPLLSEVDSFVDTCVKYDIDCYLLPSITGVESTFGRFILPGSFNPFGWGGGYIIFDSWSDGIQVVGKGLRTNYMDRWDAQTIDEIAPIYAASPRWASKVYYFHEEFVRMEEEKRLYFSRVEVEL